MGPMQTQVGPFKGSRRGGFMKYYADIRFHIVTRVRKVRSCCIFTFGWAGVAVKSIGVEYGLELGLVTKSRPLGFCFFFFYVLQHFLCFVLR